MDENQQTPSASEPQKGVNLALVVGIIVVIIVIIGAFWMTNNQSKTAQNAKITETQETVVPSQTSTELVANAITVEGGEFYFKPNEIRVKQGEKVTITLKNAGKMSHDFVLDEFNVRSETINEGTTTVEFTPDKKGTFEFYCSVGSHRKMGMKGNLIVE